MRRVLKIAGSVVLVLLVAALVVYWFRPRVLFASGERVPLRAIDHQGFSQLLQKYVNEDGLVAYARWHADAADRKALRDYLVQLCSAELGQPASHEEQLAFWINAYNALTLEGVLQKYPTTSIRNHTPELTTGYNIWKDLELKIDGQNYSLDRIEHKVLRPMGEPRIHFAINCASRGCPPLRKEAYTAGRLEEQLADNARWFFASPSNFMPDEAEGSVAVSELIKWFGTDFAPTPHAQMQVLRPDFPRPGQLGWLDRKDLIVDYLTYDWQLNDQQPPGR